MRPLLRLEPTDNRLAALMRMHSQGETLAEVVDGAGRTLGIVTAQGLGEPLFRGEEASATQEEVGEEEADD